MRLIGVVDEYGGLVGITFIISTSITAIKFLWSILSFILDFVEYKQLKTELRKLNNYEKRIVNKLLSSNDYTTALEISSGSVRALETKKIIVRTSNIGVAGSGNDPAFPFTLNPWVVDEISKLSKDSALL